jgi:uncharacterized protein (TIGR02145 family)
MANVSSFLYLALVFSLGLWGISCTPDYLRPKLPGRLPIVTTLSHQNPAVVNRTIRLNARIYDGEEGLEEIGFLLSSTPNFAENGQGVQKVKCNISSLVSTSQGEQIFSADYGVGSSNGVTRYYKAFGKNSKGIGYGQEFSYLTTTQTSLATVTTTSVSSVTSNSATVEGYVTSDGGSNVTERGFAYGTETTPTTDNNAVYSGQGIGLFSRNLTNLAALTPYYLRAYAANSLGIAYGNQVTFTTTSAPSFPCGTSTVIDVDNNTYNTVQIGTQCWTKSNLRVSKYRNGDNIPTGLDNSPNWSNTTSGTYAVYNNTSANDGIFGKLYNHYAVMDSRGLCPTGWHIPTDVEWNQLVNYLGGNNVAGGALKNTEIYPVPGGWLAPNDGALNSSGFTAMPGGYVGFGGIYGGFAGYGHWWTSTLTFNGANTSALRIQLSYGSSGVGSFGTALIYGCSVRCLKD